MSLQVSNRAIDQTRAQFSHAFLQEHLHQWTTDVKRAAFGCRRRRWFQTRSFYSSTASEQIKSTPIYMNWSSSTWVYARVRICPAACSSGVPTLACGPTHATSTPLWSLVVVSSQLWVVCLAAVSCKSRHPAPPLVAWSANPNPTTSSGWLAAPAGLCLLPTPPLPPFRV